MYQKEIIYMGLYKDGSRIGNAGFLKVENREKESRLDLKLRNIPYNIRGRFPIRIYDGSEWKEINGISVQEGNGSWNEDMAGTAAGAQIQIMLPGGYLLEGKSKNALENISWPKTDEKRDAEVAEGREEKEKAISKNDVKEYKSEEMSAAPQESMYENIVRNIQEDKRSEETKNIDLSDNITSDIYEDRPGQTIQNTSQNKAEEITGHRDIRSKERVQNDNTERRQTIIITEELQRMNSETRSAGLDTAPEPPSSYSLKEDKWEQILDVYEKIHPYGDERIYVKLEPKDFIILQAKYQHLVNNSFLLHGFYNYRYVILGKEQDYYLGVPGVFYEREKMVALMFGFEAFECSGGVAKAGEFGYYLRKVEL